jgi:CheY-like chemotaxis protein
MAKIEKVLIIDDSRLSRFVLRKSLSNYNFVISEANSGLSAFEILKQGTPDLIFLDLLMPQMDGFSFLEKFRESNIDTPVVILSADIQISTREKCKNLGATSFLNKPSSSDEIEKLVFGITKGIINGII